MRNIKLVLQYDGTDYRGWQSQKKGLTVQDTLEDCIKKITGARVRVTGAGRTDAGVHALRQVASFKTDSELETSVMKRALNAILPLDIRVASASEAKAEFNPRYDAGGKRYLYLIANTEFTSPFVQRYVWHIPQPLDVEAMRRAALRLLGRRDFRAFMGAGSSVKDTRRRLLSLEVRQMSGIGFLGARLSGRFIRITAEADGFLKHMVRNLAGTLVEVGRGKMPASRMRGILSSKDRSEAGPTAPARGLFLEKVTYVK